MNCISIPSLEHLALVRTSIILWNQDYLMTLIHSVTNFNYEDTHDIWGIEKKKRKEWKDIEERVLESVLQLPLPNFLKDKLSYVIKPIGLELFDWLAYYFRKFHMILPNRLCWTPRGTVDKKKTVKDLVRDERVPLNKRFFLACDNCLEEDIRGLWCSVLKSNERERLFDNDGNLMYFFVWPELVEHPCWSRLDYWLVAFWVYYITEDVLQLHRIAVRQLIPYRFCFEFAASGNEEALQYFLNRLNSIEREECLTKYLIENKIHFRVNSSNVISLLLSQMNEEEQVKFLTAYSLEVLNCLLKWPFQNFFMEVYIKIDRLGLLDDKKYMCLLENIIEKVSEGYKDWNYQEILKEIWRKSPRSRKIYVLSSWTGRYTSLLENLADQGNIKIILKDFTALEKQNIIFSGKRCCLSLIYNEEWAVLKSFIQECISSQDMMIEFKNKFNEDFEKMFKISYRVNKVNDTLYEFYLLLNKLIRKGHKTRKIRDVEDR